MRSRRVNLGVALLAGAGATAMTMTGGCGLPRDGSLAEVNGGGSAATSSTSSNSGGSGATGGVGATGGAGATGGGGSGATGGSGGCSAPSECPGSDATCHYRSCDSGSCGFADAPLGEPCTEDDGESCDGAGSCLKNDGTGCLDGAECLSGECVDSVCCATACGGVCESCAVPGSEGACTPSPAGTDLDSECTGVCDGAGVCADGEHVWSKLFGNNWNQSGRAVAFDSQGNVIVVGWFGGSVDFGLGAHNSAGNADGFVAKLASDGTPLWSKRFGGVDEDVATSVAIGPNNTVVVTGWFSGSVDFGGGVRASAGARDLFVLTLDASGNHVRSDRFGGTWSDWGESVAVGSDGSVVVVGGFYSPSLSFGGAALTKTGEAIADAFVAKLSSAGQHTWSASYGENGTGQVAHDVALDANGNAMVVGEFVGSMSVGTVDLASAGNSDVWTAGFAAADGTPLWARAIGGTAGDAAYRVAVAPPSEVAFVGEFLGTTDFGTGPLTSSGSSDAFVVQASGQDGATIAAARYGDGAYQAGWGVAIDGRGNVVSAGEFAGVIDLGGGALTSGGVTDVYVAKHAATGEHLWSHGFGDGSEQYLNDAAVSSDGRVAVVGSCEGTVDFGGGALVSAGGTDVCLALFTP